MYRPIYRHIDRLMDISACLSIYWLICRWINISVSRYIDRSAYPGQPIGRSTYRSIGISTDRYTDRSIYQYTDLSVGWYVCASIYRSIYSLLICRSLCLSIYPSIDTYICRYINHYIDWFIDMLIDRPINRYIDVSSNGYRLHICNKFC
jgi:hypothetical protein